MGVANFAIPQGAWSYGKSLVATNEAPLPPYCVKCGMPASEPPVKRRFSWHPSWVYVFILLALLLYAIIAMLIRKQMVLHVPLCSKHKEKYKGLQLAAIILLLGFIPEMLLSAAVLPESYKGLGILAGIVAMFAGLVCLALYTSVLRPSYIDGTFGYFEKASPEFLKLLPPPPPGVIRPR